MATNHLSGTIYDAHDAVLQRVIIQAFDQDFRKQEQLGEATTDARGVYQISYETTKYANAEHGSADIFIRILDAGGTLLGQSDVHFNAAGELVLDFKIDSAGTIDEFDTLAQRIKPLIEPQHVSIGELHEDGQFKDIDFLSGETGEQREKISFINTAFKLSKETNIAPDIFYGLFRMSFPTELHTLLLIKSESMLKALQQAIKENIISSRWSNELDGAVKIFNGLAGNQVLDGNNGQSAAFKKAMGSVLSADQQKIFVDTWIAHEAKPEEFWEQLKQQPGFTDGNSVEKVKQVGRLNIVTGNQPELTNQLFKAQERDEELKDIRGFAKFDQADWKEKIKEAGVADFPQWVSGNTPEEKTENYAVSLEQLHKQLYPTAFFAKRLLKDNQSSFLSKQELDTFFSKNPEFDLKTTRLQKQFEVSDFNGISDAEALKKDLKTLNRLHKVTDEYEAVRALHSNELYSATDIVTKYGEEQFKKQFASALGSDTNAADLYAKARSVSNKTTALLIAYKMRHDVKLYAIDGNNPASEGYHEMFGDGELCDCEHCQSVYSPAAYFVDMLAFIKDNNGEAFNELLRRRPDLDDILLTCKNTNTPLPYIDLVNELLEKEVVKISGLPDTEGITVLNHSHQTEGNAAELAAMPEHVSTVAYTALQNLNEKAVFSTALPLALPLEEVRIYSDKLGWKRHELLESFYGNNEPDKYNPGLAAELFEFSEGELKIIIGTTPLAVTLPQTNDVRAFLEKTKLSYIELLQLLETYFLNPKVGEERLLHIEQSATEQVLTCNLEKLIITGADNAWLNKMVRFVRLWKKLGWDVFDLDRTFTGIGLTEFPATETEFNKNLLLPLSHIERIHRLLNVPIREAITFFANIDTAIYIDHSKESLPTVTSLYEQIFRNKTVTNLNGSPFTENGVGFSGSLVSHQDAICAVLGITAADFVLLTQEGELLSLDSLSRLYRNILLVKALRTSVNELQGVISISDKKTVNDKWSTSTLIEFLDEWKLFKSTSIGTDAFHSLIINKIGADYKLPVDDVLVNFIDQNLDDITQITNDTTITETLRKEHFNNTRNQFLLDLVSKVAPITSLANDTLTHSDDLVLKKGIEEYLGDKNKEILQLLPYKEFIDKLRNLKGSLSEYLLLKTTPLILKKLGFNNIKIQWLKNEKEAIDIKILWDEIIDLNNTNLYPAFQRLLYLSKLDKIKTDSPSSTWMDLLEIAIRNQGQAKSDFFDSFIKLYKVSDNSLVFLAGSRDEPNNKGRLNLAFPEDYCENTKFLLDILDCCKLMDELRGNTEQLQSLLKTDIIIKEDAQAVKNLLKSKYSNKEWLNIIKPINDRLRTKRRDALVAWLLASANAEKWQNTNDIYESLLIDTEMSACMFTSRIKQAIGSVQLFIDRCLMNLETILNKETSDPDDIKTIILGEKFSKQWNTWRKLEQFWTANRKVFLYPENWIEPDLRDGKSPFFKELESQLKQNEVTEETAKEALITYLGKLDAVANLEMVGLFNDEDTKIVHVFGRTQNIPHQYFYRKQQHAVWTAWEKVEVDIEGDHILPVVWNGRLMLFWAQFTEKQEDTGQGFVVVDGNADMAPAPKYLEIKLAWSEYKKGKWGAKKITKESNSLLAASPLILEQKHISFSPIIDEGKLYIRLICPPRTDIDTSLLFSGSFPIFVFDGCNSSPKLVPTDFNVKGLRSMIVNKLPLVDRDKMMIEEKTGADSFGLFDTGTYKSPSNGNINTLFRNTPGIFQLLPDQYEIEKDKPVTFFYNNEVHNFYAYSKEKRMPRGDDYSVDNSGIMMMARRTASPLNTHPTSRLNSNGTPTAISRTIEDLVNPNIREWMSEVIEPSKIFLGKKYLFQTFYHPYVCSYIKRLNTKGIDDLYTEEVQQMGYNQIFSSVKYDPTAYVLQPYPVEDLDFSFGGAYSLYNWELFFHIPLLIATRLSQNQKFGEARKWFHYIFDPTKSTENVTGAERFWITKPFKKEIIDVVTLEELLSEEEYAEDLNKQLNNWEQNPFNPHSVARLRVSAYMRNTVLKYIDNLIAWGDQLFKRDTIESINEATLLYILASNILGKKLEQVPPRAKPTEQSFHSITQAGQLDRFSNAKVAIESFISPSSPGEAGENIRMPYFCLPKNDNLLKYWDTVADRLFKIRHCQNIEGVFRQLRLFEPQIDPGLLVRATAAGLDLNSILNDVNISLPHYRFQVMLQKANELCNDVKMLGSSLLSALEKKDAEEMALLRSGHELKMLEMVRDIKERQRDEANENLNSLQASRVVIEERENYYGSRQFMNIWEALYFQSSYLGLAMQTSGAEAKLLAAILHKLPDVKVGAPTSAGATTGGSTLGAGAELAADGLSTIGFINSAIGLVGNTMGGYQRRMDDWKFQAKSAELELKQIDKQIVAAEIRLAIAEKDLENHDQQTEHSREVDDYMRSKFSNYELYDWMVNQVSTVYFQSYQLAYTTAKKAERCMQHELGIESTSYIQFGYWDSLKKGLLSGEKLQYDLRRLENAYLEQNKREYELTKHISLAMLNPFALIQLRSMGSSDFEIPEVLYDMDHAGHYFRRLKSVSISLPCIAGPYTSVSATLKLTDSKCRTMNKISDDSLKPFGKGQSIAASNAQNDSGIFELNFRDERYLPFEGAGAISSWTLELPEKIRQFDYNTISDVVMHVKYTARDGGVDLKKDINKSLEEKLALISQQWEQEGLHIAINMKHDLPNEWHLLTTNGSVELKIDKSRLPYMAQSLVPKIEDVMFVAVKNDPSAFSITIDATAGPKPTDLQRIDELKLYRGNNSDIKLGIPFSLSVADADKLKQLEELILIVKYSF